MDKVISNWTCGLNRKPTKPPKTAKPATTATTVPTFNPIVQGWV